jgi:hypothetical protein
VSAASLCPRCRNDLIDHLERVDARRERATGPDLARLDAEWSRILARVYGASRVVDGLLGTVEQARAGAAAEGAGS